MTSGEGWCKVAHMDASQDATRRFVSEILRATGWTPTRLATEAAVAHTTISRFLNNQEVGHTLSTRTLDKIRQAAATVIPQDQVDTLWLLSQRAPPVGNVRRARSR